jgi:hypothetical protein
LKGRNDLSADNKSEQKNGERSKKRQC